MKKTFNLRADNGTNSNTNQLIDGSQVQLNDGAPESHGEPSGDATGELAVNTPDESSEPTEGKEEGGESPNDKSGQPKVIEENNTILQVTLSSGAVTIGRTLTIRCIDCNAPRIIKPQDAFQVKRCVECQKKSLRNKRAEKRKAKNREKSAIRAEIKARVTAEVEAELKKRMESSAVHQSESAASSET